MKSANRFSASLLLLVACMCAQPLAAREGRTGKQAAAVEYLREHAHDPYDYVVEQFRDHDLVLVGEWHLGRQNLEYLQNLIPRLPAAGVFNLAYEFAYAQDQEQIDRLVNAATYDAALANEIVLNWAQEGRACWPNQEYNGVFRVIWEVNRRLAAAGEVRRFRLVALGVPATPTQRWQVPGGKSILDIQVRNELMGADYLEAINFLWLQITDREILKKGEKALVYAGSGHTHTRFFSDESPRRHSISYGNLLHNYIGERVFQAVLHGALTHVTHTVEDAIRAAGTASAPVAFQVRGTPLGALEIDRNAGPTKLNGYVFGTGRSDPLTLEDLTDGYIYLGPVAEAKPVELVPNLVTVDNAYRVLRTLRLGMEKPLDRDYSLEDIERLRTEALTQRFKAQYDSLNRRYAGAP